MSLTDTLLALVPQYGAWLIALTTFASCLALPVPSSLLMLAGGAFAAGGDLSVSSIMAGAFLGAVLGDQVGFALGRWGAPWIDRFTRGHPKRQMLLDRARAFSQRWGGPGVFFSRWLVSPLGPYVNFLSGAARMNWARFSLWDLLGEAVWVTTYTGLGFAFASQIEALGTILGNASGVLAAGLMTVLLGMYLKARLREIR